MKFQTEIAIRISVATDEAIGEAARYGDAKAAVEQEVRRRVVDLGFDFDRANLEDDDCVGEAAAFVYYLERA